MRYAAHHEPAISGVSFDVKPGEVVAISGGNGCGKSSVLKLIAGIYQNVKGRVLLFGEPVKPGARALARVGALVDGPGFVPHLSGLDNLRLGLQELGHGEVTHIRDAQHGLLMDDRAACRLPGKRGGQPPFRASEEAPGQRETAHRAVLP